MKKISLVLLTVLAACSASRKTAMPLAPASSVVINGKILATAYMQRAAEYRALCYQAYNIARLRIDQYLTTADARPRAIITDIDETILDNSPYEAHQTLRGLDYQANSWYDWTAKAVADTVPGAAGFLRYAASKGIEVFYVTNREGREKAATKMNLQRLQLPNCDDQHVIVRQNTSSKEERRQAIMEKYDVLLLLGDNLADFSVLFDRKTTEERNRAVTELASQFGERFIVLPNPTYGDWESALYRYNYNLTPTQKDSVVKASLKSY